MLARVRLVVQLYLPADFILQGIDGCLLYGVQPGEDGVERVVQGALGGWCGG